MWRERDCRGKAYHSSASSRKISISIIDILELGSFVIAGGLDSDLEFTSVNAKKREEEGENNARPTTRYGNSVLG